MKILKRLLDREDRPNKKHLSGQARGAGMKLAFGLLAALIDGHLDDEEKADLKELWADFIETLASTSDRIARTQEAYKAYGGVTNFKNYQGLPMPEWDNLTDKIREAWIAAIDRASVLALKG